MTAVVTWLRAWVAMAVATATLGAWAVPSPAYAEDTAPAKVLLLLDVSGSMNEPISSGGTKFAAAKRALRQVADALPAGTQVGLRVYGSEIAEPQEDNPEACRDTELVLPVGPLDRAKMYRAVDSFEAVGETPIAYSLGKSVEDLGTSGRRVLVLISDGEESCAGDPCPAARKLAQAGVDLQFNAVGLDVGAKAREQLECIAEAGDGSYYDADEADDLSEAIRKITTRALRPFGISGTPVAGTKDPAGAPELEVGQYRDRYDSSETVRYYRVPRAPGSTVTVGVTSLVRARSQTSDSWELELASASGESCDETVVRTQAFQGRFVVSGAVRSTNPGSESVDACQTEPLVLSLRRRTSVDGARTAPVEIVVQAEPPIVNLADLPPGVSSSYDGRAEAVAATGPRRRVVGGTSFTDAPLLQPGAYADAPAVGETVLYRVRLQTGQRMRVTVKAPAPRGSWRLGAAEAVIPTLMLYTPARTRLAQQPEPIQGDAKARYVLATPEIRVRNREVGETPGDGEADLDSASMASVAGDYYIAYEVEPGSREETGQVLPIQLNVAVDGRPAGQPQYADPSPEPSPTPSASETGEPGPTPDGSPAASPGPTGPGEADRNPVPLVLGALALAAGAAAVAFRLGRRRPSRP